MNQGFLGCCKERGRLCTKCLLFEPPSIPMRGGAQSWNVCLSGLGCCGTKQRNRGQPFRSANGVVVVVLSRLLNRWCVYRSLRIVFASRPICPHLTIAFHDVILHGLVLWHSPLSFPGVVLGYIGCRWGRSWRCWCIATCCLFVECIQFQSISALKSNDNNSKVKFLKLYERLIPSTYRRRITRLPCFHGSRSSAESCSQIGHDDCFAQVAIWIGYWMSFQTCLVFSELYWINKLTSFQDLPSIIITSGQRESVIEWGTYTQIVVTRTN